MEANCKIEFSFSISNLCLIFIFISFFIFVLYVDNSFSQIEPLWQVTFNDSIPETNYAVKSKIDNQDNIVILARGTNNSLGTGVDFILIKYDANGEKLWNRRFDGTGHSSDYPSDMTIDKDNNIYVTGRSWGGTTRNDYLTLKYSPDGDLLWSRRFDWLVSRNDEAYSIALDSNQNVYVTGLATAAYNGNELYDMVTVKYNTAGDQVWVRSFAGYGDAADWGYSVVCDLNDNVIVSGFTRSKRIGHDIISVKYDSSGNEIWQKRFFNHGDDYIRPLMSRVDANSNIIIASYYKGDSTRIDYLTYKYDPAGNLLWSKIYDGGVRNTDWINDLTIDRSNNVIITGASRGVGTGYDFLTIKYSSSGEQLWLSRINDTDYNNNSSNDYGQSILSDRNENILVLGYSDYTQDYSSVLMYESTGHLITKFRNFAITDGISINLFKNSDFAIVGLTDPKTVTAKYLNIITNVSLNKIISPVDYLLLQNYPNPFNPKTIINYQLESTAGKTSFISIKVYDVLGNEVTTLVSEKKPAGNYQVEFNGNSYSSGIYFYSLFVNNQLIGTKRMILLK
jgi:Secretion system C-terminal sorting domain/Beta-propeller repeat